MDIINDNRCFNSTPAGGKKWRVLVKMLFETDKSALAELLSKSIDSGQLSVGADC